MLNRLLQFFAYSVSGILGIGLAFWLTSNFIVPSQSQVEVDNLTPPPPPPFDEAGAAPPPPPEDLIPITASDSTEGQKDEMAIVGDIETLMAPYNYDFENRRDPFKEFRLDVSAEVTEEGVFVGPLRPLQRFELDMIIPVAIIWDVESPKAMFIDPTNEVHILGKDERIGKNNGYVAAIREGEVVVIETVKRKGQLSFKTSILKIGSSTVKSGK